MKSNLLVFLSGLAAVFAISSCSSESDVDNTLADGSTTLEKYTFKMSESLEDSTYTRAVSATRNDTTVQYFGGWVMQTIVEDEGRIAPTRTTNYGTVDFSQSPYNSIYAIVYDASTNKILDVSQVATPLTVTKSGSDYSITVGAMRGSKVAFYIGSKPTTATVGNDISTVTVSENNSTDAMYCTSDVITGASTQVTPYPIVFKHVFSKVRMTLGTSDGTTVNSFNITMSGIANSKATVNVSAGTYSVTGADVTTALQKSGNTTSAATSDYVSFISKDIVNTMSPTLTFQPFGAGATVNGAQNYLRPSINDAVTLSAHQFLGGHRYTVKLITRPAANTFNSAFATEYAANNNLVAYYEWDACSTYPTDGTWTSAGDTQWGTGYYGVHNGAAKGTAIYNDRQKKCPTASQAIAYFTAGAYWDEGQTGAGQQSFTLQKNSTTKITYHSGVWIKTKDAIVADGGTFPSDTETSPSSPLSGPFTKFSSLTLEQRTAIRTGGKYFFLPAAGLGTSGNVSWEPNTNYGGTYWLSTPSSDSAARFIEWGTDGKSWDISGSFPALGRCIWTVQNSIYAGNGENINNGQIGANSSANTDN